MTVSDASLSICPGEPLARHTALRTGGMCEAWVVAHDLAGLATVVADCRRARWRVTMLGAGTRTVVRDGPIPGAVVRLGTGFNHIVVDGASVTVGAGTPVPALVATAARHGHTGLEGHSCTPGSVGASVLLDDGWDEVVQHVAILRRGRARRGGAGGGAQQQDGAGGRGVPGAGLRRSRGGAAPNAAADHRGTSGAPRIVVRPDPRGISAGPVPICSPRDGASTSSRHPRLSTGAAGESRRRDRLGSGTAADIGRGAGQEGPGTKAGISRPVDGKNWPLRRGFWWASVVGITEKTTIFSRSWIEVCSHSRQWLTSTGNGRHRQDMRAQVN